jgi:hypothetical protein
MLMSLRAGLVGLLKLLELGMFQNMRLVTRFEGHHGRVNQIDFLSRCN